MKLVFWMLLCIGIVDAGELEPERNLDMFGTEHVGLGQTWIGLDGQVYGAQPDERGPIGGGDGYRNTIAAPEHRIATLDQLLEALQKANAGDVIFIDGKAEIDCTTRVHIEQLVLEIPEGVTLASDRGQYGSAGGLIYSDTFATRPLIRVMGPNVRITGLRLRGPNPNQHLEHHHRSFAEGRGHEYYYRFPTSDGVATDHGQLEVDNCGLGGWSHAAVCLRAGDGHHIHHNFIHHNQYQGLGYGVSHNQASSLIEYNLFNYNRHSIAGTGRPSCGYEARHNVEIGASLSHCFDMHGGRDRKDGTDIAGTWLQIHHNTFRAPRTAIVIRGVPQEGAEVHHNWFYQEPNGTSVRSDGKTQVLNNAYGLTNTELVQEAEPRRDL